MCHTRHSLSCTYTATNTYAVCNAVSRQCLNYSLACRDAGSNQLASIQSGKLDSTIVYYAIVWCQVRMSLYEASSGLSSHFDCWFFRNFFLPMHQWCDPLIVVRHILLDKIQQISHQGIGSLSSKPIGALEFHRQLAKLAVKLKFGRSLPHIQRSRSA